MTREQIFKEFNITIHHNIWNDEIDNWHIIEICSIMKGNLPFFDDSDCTYILEFLYKFQNDIQFANEINAKYPQNWGSLFLTAKRSIYRFIDYIENDESVDIFFESIKKKK